MIVVFVVLVLVLVVLVVLVVCVVLVVIVVFVVCVLVLVVVVIIAVVGDCLGRHDRRGVSGLARLRNQKPCLPRPRQWPEPGSLPEDTARALHVDRKCESVQLGPCVFKFLLENLVVATCNMFHNLAG